jgi:GT2 family glycosyltransferase
MKLLLLRAVATLKRVFSYGGIGEVFGLTKNLLVDCGKRILFLGRGRPRVWPEWSPELLLWRRYREGRWILEDEPLRVSKPKIIELDELLQYAIASSNLPPKRVTDTYFSGIRGHSVTVRAGERDEESLTAFFRHLYKTDNVQARIADDTCYGRLIWSNKPTDSYRLSVIVPTRDGKYLHSCLSSLRKTSNLGDFELIIVDNGSMRETTLSYLRALSKAPHTVVLRDDNRFNWSRLNNQAARIARGDVLLFMNDDVEAIAEGWTDSFASFPTAQGIGCVGPLLSYSDSTIQHAGVVVGMGRWADHLYKGVRIDRSQDAWPFPPPWVTRPVLGLTGACLAVSKKNFGSLGGFDESFEVVFSDIELCVRAHAAGLRNVFEPNVTMIHHESKTRDPTNVPVADFLNARKKLSPYRVDVSDPYYNWWLSKFNLQPGRFLSSDSLRKWTRDK